MRRSSSSATTTGRATARPAAWLVAGAILLAAGGAFAAPKPLWRTAPKRGHIDDAMAFDSAGKRFAYIHTDSATFLRLIVIDVHGFSKLQTIEVGGATKVPQQLVFSRDGKRIALVWKDAKTTKLGIALYAVAGGKQLGKLSGASAIAVLAHGGKQRVSFVKRRERRGNVRLNVALHDMARLKRVKRAHALVRADQMLKGARLRLLYWEPGYVQAIGMRKGRYDAKRDIRLPELAVRYDIVTRKQVWSTRPDQLMSWEKALGMRGELPAQRRFLKVSDDLKKLYYVDRKNRVATVKTPVAWRLYEPKSLVQRLSWSGERLLFSMTIDPVNPDAVKRKKADEERMDLYRLDPGPKVVPLGRVPTGKRRFSWAVGSKHFAYLRKLKGFGRGGKVVELYRIGAM